MDWITAIQMMLTYMEENLMGDISYEDIAKTIHISNMYCHQAFRLLVGMTPTEYIRKRRLSLAGQELNSTDTKVIDVALKYGFESPESFTKAFTRFHGINPRQAKLAGATLTLFQPIKIEYRVKGGKVTDYRIEQREAFNLLVCERTFNIERTNEKGNHEIPDFWEESWKNGLFDCLNPFGLNQDHYAICSPLSKESNDFNYGIGVMCASSTKVPEGCLRRRVEGGLWAVFPCFGKDGNCMEQMWENIYYAFLPESGYTMRDYADFECYPGKKSSLFSEIWVPIQKK
ncbi:MAG TPA: effector binding domain-containing protein [Lachnospiraceae bacterium]|nr:effector binding domain-containing protein [Lachnospiraceae bacterium]